MRAKIAAVALIALLASVPSAWAAKYGVITVDATPVLGNRDPGAQPLELLNRGQTVGASDQDYGGYYRVRTAQGTVGWIAAERLQIRDYPSAGQNAQPQRPAATASSDADFRRFAVRPFGGMSFLNMSTAYAASVPPTGGSGFTGLTLSYAFGGEFGVYLIKRLALVVRGEYLLGSSTGQDSSFNYSFYSSAIPIYGGAQFNIVDLPRFMLRISAYAGYCPSIGHVVSNVTQGTTVSFAGSGFTAMGKLDFELRLTPLFSLLIGGGYRYLNGGTFDTSSSPVGISVYYGRPIALDLGGIIAQAGIGLNF